MEEGEEPSAGVHAPAGGRIAPSLANPDHVLPNPCLKAPQKHPWGCGTGFFHPQHSPHPPARLASSLKSLRCTFRSYWGKNKQTNKRKIRKKRSPSQAPRRDCRQFGDGRGRESRRAPALDGVSLQKPGAEGFSPASDVMS